MCVDGLLNEVRHEAHVPACLVIAATSTLKESSRVGEEHTARLRQGEKMGGYSS